MKPNSMNQKEVLNQLSFFTREFTSIIADVYKSSPNLAELGVLKNKLEELSSAIEGDQHQAPPKTTGSRGECTPPSPEEDITQKPSF